MDIGDMVTVKISNKIGMIIKYSWLDALESYCYMVRFPDHSICEFYGFELKDKKEEQDEI